MATRTLLTGSVLAAVLLAGCSGTPNNDNARASDTTSTATSATTTTATTRTDATVESSETTTSDAATEDATADTGAVEPASLDEESKAWFGAFCTGLTGAFTGMMGAMSGAMGGAMGTMAAADPKATQAAMATAFQQVAAAFTATATSLEGLPAPTVDNGDQLAGDLTGALNALGEGFADATDTFAAADVTDEASLSAAMDAFQAETDRYGSELEAQFGDLDSTLTPEITAAVEALPECQMMSS